MAVAVAEFQALLAQLAARLGLDLSRLLRNRDRLDTAELLQFITDAYPEVVTPYLAAAAELTAQWYDEQPASTPQGLFVPQPAQLLPIEQLASSGRWAMLQRSPVLSLQGSGTRAVFTVSRDTVLGNANREGVLWARHASATACGFCRMLATRGAVYSSQATAQKAHDHCHCLAVPDRDGNYKPAPYVDQWHEDYLQARRDGARTPAAIANSMDQHRADRDNRANLQQRSKGADPKPASGTTA